MKRQLVLVAVEGLVFLLTNRLMQENTKEVCVEESHIDSLELENISYGWKVGEKVLNKCNLSISSPGLWMIVGSNGSGKSTLFRLISGLIGPQEGKFSCSFKPALMFQNPDHQLLLPSCSSDLLLSLPLDLDPNQRLERINSALSQVGLDNMVDRPIHTLSGGQKQRLALAGALASEANLLLLDEPTALLDPSSQRSIVEIVRKITRKPYKTPITALWITHRLEELTFCDAAAIMEQGRLGQWFSGEQVMKKFM